ncbi:HTH-type transcriptional activator RhaR [bioreactor metagenome]|uniref:HTH-type transcriptional activator RhaR n=1 Tax=bioreactor metagenome TaxID=1076179 RepID=A0A645DEJ0_9ZZZZ
MLFIMETPMRTDYYASPNLKHAEYIASLDLRLRAMGLSLENPKTNLDVRGCVFFRLYLPTSGAFRMKFSNSWIDITPGAFYLIPAIRLFAVSSIEPCSHYWLHFLSGKLENDPHFWEPIRHPVADPQPVIQQLEQLMALVGSAASVADTVAVRNHLSCMLVPFLEHVLDQNPAVPAVDYDNRMTAILRNIEQNLDQELRVADLARSIGISSVQFSALFNQFMKMPPRKYITQLRMTKAKQLLWETNASVKEIAAACGFPDAYFFSRMFRAREHQTPLQYRKNYAKL